MKHCVFLIAVIISCNWCLAQDKPNANQVKPTDSLKTINQKLTDSMTVEVKTISDSLKIKRLEKELQQLKANRHNFFSPMKAIQKLQLPPPPPPVPGIDNEKIIELYQEDNVEAILESYSQEMQQESIIVDEIYEVSKAVIIDLDNEVYYNKARLRGPSNYDSRVEVRILNPEIEWQRKILEKNKSVAIVVEKEKLSKINEQFYQLDISTSLANFYNLCTNVPFKNQPVIGVGTAFITSRNQMTTAKHVFQRNLENYAIVFGYELLNKNGIVEAIVNKKNVYEPISKVYNNDYYDVTIIELDRPVNRPILAWENSKLLEDSTEVYMIGHPSGIPKKIALNAGIIDNSNSQYFHTTLDSFQGNSGSPVFNRQTHNVIGILVSGELDYKYNGTCNEINVCKLPYCKGEKVVRIDNILKN
ncbi:MAG: serine protease [Psychroserpens sp.]|uniref:trypsin-like serine peptidase n=1 Tax=Psychroserpens sp. TaxID=2020870 RepID=UPI003001A1C2